MNRSLLHGFLAGLALAVVVGVVAFRARPGPAASPAQASPGQVQAQPQAGRYQLVSSVEILMLDTGTGELWFYRKGRWHRAASPPRDDGDRSAVLGELEEPRALDEVAEVPAPPVPAAPPSPEERGRAEVIQVETAPERAERPGRRR